MDRCWGAGGFATAIAKGSARLRLQGALRRSLLLSGGVAAATSLAAIPLQAATITSSWTSALMPDMVLNVALDTSFGRVMLVHTMMCVVMFVAACRCRQRTAVLAAALALSSSAASGHAGETIITAVLDVVHVLCATAWVGALIPFLLLLRMVKRLELRADATRALRNFSGTGHVAVGLVLLSGAANTLLILGHPPTDLTLPYQVKFLIKIAVALTMTCLAIVNRYRVVPRCRSHPRSSQRILGWVASAEIVLGLLAFALVASLGLDDPSRKNFGRPWNRSACQMSTELNRQRKTPMFGRSYRTLDAFAALVIAAGGASAALAADVAPTLPSVVATSDTETAYLAETDAAMDKMMADMAVKPTGDVDRDFVAMMTPHHQGAIDMALAVLKFGKNEQLKRIAQEIIVDQQQEIAAMKLAIGDPLPPSEAAPTQVAPETSPAQPMPGHTMQGMDPNMRM